MAPALPKTPPLLPFAIATFLHLATAVSWIEPQPTPEGLLAQDGVSPKPTLAPFSPLGHRNLFAKRGCVPVSDYVCGYISGLTDSRLTCKTAATCVYDSAYFGCCTHSNIDLCTTIVSSCRPYAAGCDIACLENPRVIYCGDSLKPLCNTWSFPGGTLGYNCGTDGTIESINWPWQIFPSICSSPRIIQTVEITITVPSTPTAILPTSIITSTHSPSPTSKPATLSRGAIAGIVIGSVAVLAAVAVGLLYFCCVGKHRNSSPRSQQPVMAGPAEGGGYAPPPRGQYYSGAVAAAVMQDAKPPLDTVHNYGPEVAVGGGYVPQNQGQYPLPPSSPTSPSPYGNVGFQQQGQGYDGRVRYSSPPGYSDMGIGVAPPRVTSVEVEGREVLRG